MAPELVVDPLDVDGLGEVGQMVSFAVLERNLTTWAGHIAVAEAKWLGWLGEYCERQGWAAWGCAGPTQWLQWQCGMAPATARDKVRVAEALRDLPVTAAVFGEGRLSYSKVRAITRVATPANDAHLAGLAVAATGAQLDKIVRGYAATKRLGPKTAWEQRQVSSRRDDELGTMAFKLTVPIDDGELIAKMVNKEVELMITDGLGQRNGGDGADVTRSEYIASRGGIAAMRSDAHTALVLGTARSNESVPADVTLIASAEAPQTHTETHPVHQSNATAEAVAESMNQDVAERLSCDAMVTALIEDATGSPIGVGRTTRVPNRKTRRALERRDKGECQFPGCCTTRRLQAHHIVHWANGGPTELDNLILVCNFHHHLVHEGGWNIDPATRRFMKPDGVVIEPVPPHQERFRGSASVVEQLANFTTPRPLGEATYEPFDLGLTIETLCVDNLGTPQGPALPPHLKRAREGDAFRATRAAVSPIT